MEKTMKAICTTPNNGVNIQYVKQPQTALAEHLVIKMHACAINPGDIAFITRPLPLGAVKSLYDVYGVSGVGTVLETGPGVPENYRGKRVAIYRSLKYSESIIGTWCEFAHMHFLDCLILPDNVDMEDYSGSLVNIITPFAFLKQVTEEGHKGIISTAGTSATGIAMVGYCLAYNFPLISIVRTEAGKHELENLGAKNILVQTDIDFKTQLNKLSNQLHATAVFDGVGGVLLSKMLDAIPNYATIYTYGYLGGPEPLTFHTSILNAKGLTIKSFGNFRSKTVQDPQLLQQALTEMASIINRPHFKTKTGKGFKPEEIDEALQFKGTDGAKAVLYFE